MPRSHLNLWVNLSLSSPSLREGPLAQKQISEPEDFSRGEKMTTFKIRWNMPLDRNATLDLRGHRSDDQIGKTYDADNLRMFDYRCP